MKKLSPKIVIGISGVLLAIGIVLIVMTVQTPQHQTMKPLTDSLQLEVPPLSITTGIQSEAGQLAVCRGLYTPPDEPTAEHNLIAVTSGENSVQLLTYDPIDGLVNRERILLDRQPNYNPFDPSFIPLDTDNDEIDENCLVLPCRNRNGTGGISIYDLENRILYQDGCFLWKDTPTLGEVYHVACISNDTNPNKNRYSISLEDEICIASFESTPGKPRFVAIDIYYLQQRHYAAVGLTLPARAFETYPINYPSLEINVALTTVHNGGIDIWSPNRSRYSISRIGVAQPGGSGLHENEGFGEPMHVDGELGDVHRAFVISNDRDFPQLLFFTNHTMGLMVYDIADPFSPQFVWQWDNDTRLTHAVMGDTVLTWHGAGSGNIAPRQGTQTPYNPPGEAFGIGGRYNTETGLIHIYLADGADGIRAFDFSDFFHPFSACESAFANFDNYYTYAFSPIQGESAYLAYDLRTLEIPGEEGTFIFTSWREHADTYTGTTCLSVHRDMN